MKEDTSPQGWELEEDADADDQWVLEESEQQLTDEWDLEGTPEPVGQWQPVEYDKPRRGGPAWILPTIVTLALVAVLGYSAYTLVPRIFGDLLSGDLRIGARENEQPPTEGTPPLEEGATSSPEEAVAGVTPDEPTAAPLPTDAPTEEPPTPAPPPTADVTQRTFATVLSEYGVNVRSGPGTEFEVLQILEQDQTFLVFDVVDAEGVEWLQLFVSDGPLAEGQPISGFAGYASAEFLATGTQSLSEEVFQAAQEAAGIQPTATPIPPTPVADEDVAGEDVAGEDVPEEDVPGDLVLPTVTPVPEPQAETPSETVVATEATTVTITVNAANGLNVRTQPELTAEVVRLLPNQTEVVAIGRFANNEWILVDLGDGATGWVFTQLVVVNGELTSLPAITLGQLPEPPPTPTETPTPEPTPIGPPVEPPEPYTSELPAGVPGAIVFSAAGVNARDLPAAESNVIAILPENAALPVVGRSANGEWLQVELPQGGAAWVFRAAIIPSGDVNSVPVTEEGAESASPTATPTSPPAETVPTEAPTTAATAAPESDVEPDSEATPEASSAPIARMRLVVVSIFGEPSSDGESIERVGAGTELLAIGRTADGAWIQVQSRSSGPGWVAAKSVELNVDADSLPVVQ
jgi:uncharacterized protein YgiM (DUF1202 family)